MLMSLRDGVKNSWIKYVILALIALPFALFGIGSYFGAGGYPPVAEVDGEEVSADAFYSAYEQQRAQVRQMFGGNIPPQLLNAGLLRQQALEQLLDQTVLTQYTDSAVMAISDAELREFIRQNPAFHQDGQFSFARYQEQLSLVNRTEASYEALLRDSLRPSQVQSLVAGTGFALPQEQRRVLELQNQQRELAYLSIDASALEAGIEPSAEALQSYYDDNQNALQEPEAVKLEYVLLERESLRDGLDYSDEDLQEYFQSNLGEFTNPEERRASHILINLAEDASDDELATATETLQAAKARIDAGESFADVAKAVSEDIGSAENGGDLGFFSQGAMVPAFEEAVFSLSVGEISEPVRSEFGLHLIQLNDTKRSEEPDFAEHRDAVEEAFVSARLQQRFDVLRDEMGNAAYEVSESLNEVASVANIEPVVTEWLNRGSADGIAATTGVMQAAFSPSVLDQNENSEVLGDTDTALVIRLRERREPFVKPLEEIKEQVQQAVVAEQARELAQARADDILQKLQAGEAASSLAEENVVSFVDYKLVARDAQDILPTVSRFGFEMSKPTDPETPNIALLDQNASNPIVVMLKQVKEGAVEDDTVLSTAPPLSQLEFNAWLQAKRLASSIRIDDDAISRVLNNR